MAGGSPAVQVGIVAASVLGLWVGARLLVSAAVRLARGVGLSDLTIGLTVVAMGTSAPELVVSVDAALKGFGDIAVGNVLGSNIYNLAFVLGVVSLIRVMPVTASLVHRDGAVLLASTAAGALALYDLRVSRPEGVLLVGALVAYTTYLLRRGGRASPSGDGARGPGASGGPGDEPVARGGVVERLDFRGRNVVFLVGGLALVLLSGDALVVAATGLARSAGVSEWVIGGTVVAAGTSTPEFAVSLVAVQRGRLGVSVGNVVGSNVFNLTGVVGVAAVVRPLAVSGTALGTVAWLAVVTVAVVAALWTGRVLSRLEGGVLTASEVGRWVLGLL